MQKWRCTNGQTITGDPPNFRNLLWHCDSNALGGGGHSLDGYVRSETGYVLVRSDSHVGVTTIIWFSSILRADYVLSYVRQSFKYKFFSTGVGQLSFSLGSYLTEIIRAPLSVVCWNSIYLFDIYICIYLAFGQHTNLVKYVTRRL